MKNDLTCAVARDLMPSCADGLAREETNEALRRHLEGCPACTAVYESMKTPAPAPETEKDKTEISYLKKVKKKHVISVLCVALAVLLLSGGVFGALYAARVYAKSPVTRDILIDLVTEVSADGKEVILRGQLADSLTLAAGGKTAFDPADGKLTFSLNQRRARTKDSNVIYEVFRTSDTVKSVYLDNVPLWDNGTVISERVGLAFAASHPYMGAMPENAASAEALEIGKTYGSFINELSTSSRPYTWTLIFSNTVSRTDPDCFLNEDAVLLLATIGNLDAVCFRWPASDASDTETREMTMTAEGANLLTGMDVKEAGRTPAGLQQLLDAYRDLLRYASSVFSPEAQR